MTECPYLLSLPRKGTDIEGYLLNDIKHLADDMATPTGLQISKQINQLAFKVRTLTPAMFRICARLCPYLFTTQGE